MPSKKWSKELLDSIYQLLSYYTLREVGDMIGLHRTYVSTLLYRHGYKNLGALRYKRFHNLTETDKAYIAGIVDGEGHISVKQQKILVNNIDKKMINWLKKKTGGSVNVKPRIKKHHKKAWVWTLSPIATRGLLLIIMPYLITRKEKAQELIREWIKNKYPEHNPELP